MQDAEDCRVGADAQREGEQRHDREARRSQQCPGCMAHVTLPIVQPPERARVTMVFLGGIDAAEGTPRSEPGVCVGQAALPELVFEERQVRVHLARQIRLGPIRQEQVDGAANQSSQCGHVVLSGGR